MLELAEIARPKLVQDGIFLVEIAIVGDKLMEINVFSQGGRNVMWRAYEKDFAKEVVIPIKRKVAYKKPIKDT